MELTVTFQHGPLDAEFTGENRAEIQQNLIEFVEFLEENSEHFEGFEFSEAEDDYEETVLDSDRWGEDDESKSETEGPSDDSHPLGPLARKANTTVESLDEIVYVDPNNEEEPQLMVDKSLLGDNKTERQRAAAYVILYVWEDCYNEERMKTSKLMNILTMSGISDNDLFNAWKGPGQGNFNPKGSGSSATVGLTGPGKRRSLKIIQDLVVEYSE